MSEEDLTSFYKVGDFISDNNLRNDNGDVFFTAEIQFKTASIHNRSFIANIDIKALNEKICYKLSIDPNIVDPCIFPTDFRTCYQVFKNNKSGDLLVSGKHKANKVIGEYEVIIHIIEKYASY